MYDRGLGEYYLERRWKAFGEEQASLRGALLIVFGHKVIGNPNTVRVLFRRLGTQGRSAVPCEWRMDDAVL